MHHDDGLVSAPPNNLLSVHFPDFPAFLTPPIDKLILVVRLSKAEVGAFRPASAAITAGHHRPRSRSDFDIVPDPSESSGIAQSQAFCENRRWDDQRRCGAACGPSTALHSRQDDPLDFL